MHSSDDILTRGAFIDGEWIARSENGEFIESVNPANGRVWAKVPDSGAAEINAAVEAAERALHRSSWSRLAASERGAMLYRYSQLINERSDEIAAAEVNDAGLTLADARTDVGAAAAWFRYFAGLADKIEGTTVPAKPDWHAYTVREPVGVVGAILPWNAPTLMYSWKVAPALAAGNTIVVKPAELTPVSALLLAEIALEAGIPPGVLNVVPGYGRTAGEALVAHPKVAKIAFTGEHRTAQHIAKVAADTLKRLSCECGGKAPHIIMADANLPKAANAAASSAFRRAGQSCALGSRIFVQDTVHAEFVDLLQHAAAKIRVGDPLDPDTDVGPQASQAQLSKTLSYVDIAHAEKSDLVFGGRRPDDPALADGYYVLPTLFDNVGNDTRLAQEEVFGPVAAVIPFSSEKEVIEAANNVIYGLTAGLWTKDLGTAHRLGRALKAGSIWTNVYPAVHWSLPYGGVKLSGYGRENGLAVMNEYTSTKTVVVNIEDDDE
ncbi:aldehyde dehydrogenase family protein [Rhodococcus pyridinivorans]|uniref:aldehyde dehydrogenase family protein n=1 Tax=Rhodococcus pyridinivorans TaxID=103816 RepID=UPI00341B561D